MVIKGLTDRIERSDRSVLGRIEIAVFKGDRKSQNSAGKTLEQNYRIVTSNLRIRKLLAAAYAQPNANGDIITDQINIYLPFDEPDRTFVTSMKAFSLSGPEVVCDRETISYECVPTKDEKGNVHRPIVPCNKPCPVVGQPISVACPRGCKPQGEFFFYIRELFDADFLVPCRMTVRGYSDIDYIGLRLEQLQQEIGSITNSPFPSFPTRHKVPFVLTRASVAIKRPLMDTVTDNGKKEYIRTGKKTNGETWAVEINPHPDYMELHRAWRLADEMRRLQLVLPQKAIAGLLQGNPDAINCIDVEVVSTPALPPSPPKTISREQQKLLFDLFRDNNWEMTWLKTLLQEKYGYTASNEILESQLQELEAIACDPDERNYWANPEF